MTLKDVNCCLNKISNNLDKGIGEYSQQDTFSQRPTCKKWLRFVAFVSTISAIAFTVLGGAGILVGVGISACISRSRMMAVSIGAVAGSSLGLCVVAAIFMLLLTRKNRTVPSTYVLGLNATDRKAPSLGEFHANHALIVTADAQESWEWKLKAIRAAEQSIELSGNYCGGQTFRQALEAVDQLMSNKPDLKFHLLASEEMLSKEDRFAIQALQKKFPERAHVLITNIRIAFEPEVRSLENHIKLLIVDGKYFVAGGSSMQDMLQTKGDGSPALHPPAHWSERFMGKASRDMDLVGRGPLGETMRLEFFKLWAVWAYKMAKQNPKLENRYFPLDPNKSLAVIEDFEKSEQKVDNAEMRLTISGAEQARNQIIEEFRRLIVETEGDIRIHSLTFNPVKDIRKALISRIKAGNNVEILTNGTKNAPIGYNFAPTHLFSYAELQEARLWKKIRLAKFELSAESTIRIYEYAIENTMMHKKAMIAGDTIFVQTSLNFSRKSLRDHEIALTVRSKPLVERVKVIFDKDIEGSVELAPTRIRTMVQHPLRRLIGCFYQFLIVRFSG